MKSQDLKLRTKITDSFTRQPFMQFIGADIVELKAGICKIKVPFRNELTQQHGYFHAGIVSTLGDNATGYAAYSMMDDTSSVLTVEFKINFMSPAIGDTLFAEGKVIKKGRNLSICQAEIFVEAEGEKRLCALLQSTIIEMRQTTDS